MTALTQAQSWLGYLEHRDARLLGVYTANAGKGGYTVFSTIAGLPQGLPWCVTFVFAVYINALGRSEAERLLGRPCPGSRTLARRMRSSGRWRERDYAPEAGDIVFLSPDGSGRIGHCGIVESVAGDTLASIDGNTVDPTGVFPPDSGGAVARRFRSRNDSAIIGYGRMK